MLKRLTMEQSKRLLLAVCDRIIAEKPCLTRLDSPIGDADHGIGMRRGMSAAKEKLSAENDFADINQMFYIVGRSMISSMGGASGVVFGMMFIGAAKGVPAVTELTGDVFIKMMKNALAAIQERGKAEAGDKTMVDALIPAIRYMEDSLSGGRPEEQGIAGLFFAAAQGAEAGAKATKDMVAKYGHSKTLGKRSIGHPDPGAVSVYFIFDEMYREAGRIESELR